MLLEKLSDKFVSPLAMKNSPMLRSSREISEAWVPKRKYKCSKYLQKQLDISTIANVKINTVFSDHKSLLQTVK